MQASLLARLDRLAAVKEIAQIGAVISSLALARKRKSALWLFAGLTGVVALAIGAYVYIGI